jgi:hypothetical protein
MFSDSSGAALDGDVVAGMHTLDGGNVYLWSSGDFCMATTSATAGAGRIVAAFYLNEAANHLSAQVQMVTFEALQHPDANNPDDALNFTDVLQVSAQGTMSFNFDNLPSGSFLYAAVGNSSAGLLVTGQDLNVTPTGAKAGNMITGGTDPSDTVNTSQGGIGATIGINSQHFTDQSGGGGSKVDGAVGVFTLVKGFTSYDATINGTSEGTGGNVNEIGYSDYVNAPSAKIFISQVTGSSSIGGAVRVTLWEAGGGSSADHLTSQLKPEEGLTDTANSYSYIGDTGTDSHLTDDTPVLVGAVTVQRGGNTYTFTGSGSTQAGITVAISSNGFTITGLVTSDTIGFSAANDPNNALDGTFNRFDVQALANSNPVDIGRIDLDQGVSISHGVGSSLIVQDDGPSIIANPANAPSITDDESVLGTNNTGDFSGNFTPTFGSDGAGATSRSYALSTPGGDSGVIDTATGLHVFLFKVGDNIVGKAGTDAANAQSGSIVVFVVSTDQNGVVTLDQQRAIVHANPDDSDESRGLTGSNLVVLTATAYDGDGDHAAAPLDITGLLNFKDDGPSIVVNGNPQPSITDDESALGVNNSANYSGDFTPTFGNDGAGATPRSYALSTPGGDSGVIDTATGLHVFLFKVGDNIVGKAGTDAANALAGSTIVFVVSVAQTGVVTLDQQRAIVHANPDDSDESRGLTGSNLVVLTATAYDGDGDHAAAPLDLTGLLNFKDDGPSIVVNGNPQPSITDDESALGVNNSANYSGDFTPTFGNDGAGATPRSYALSTPGGDSGVIDTATGLHVFLFKVGDNIVGKAGTDAANALAGSTVVFVVSTDQNGVVTLDQQRAIVHANPNDPDESRGLTGSNLVVLTATAYDGDGDHASAPLDLTGLLNFKDDGPTMTANPTGAPSITDDESLLGTNNTGDYSGNFTAVFGNDGAGATPRSYSLSTAGGDCGLIESGTGLHVFLFKVGDNLVGKSGTDATAAATGTTVFVVSINQSGVVTLDQQRAVVHNPNSGVDQSTTLSSAGLVVVNATAFDGDGDHAADSLNIGQLLNFKDDAPTITAQILGGSVAFAADATGTVSHSLNGAVGADINSSTSQSLSGVMQYTITSFDEPTSVYPNLDGVLSADGTSVTYYSDATHTLAVYQLTLNQTAGSGAGSYTFSVLQPPPIVNNHFDFTDLPSGQNLFGIIATDKAHLDKGGLLVFASNPDLAADGTMTNLSGTINTSKGGGPVTIGNGNQAFDNPGEGAYFMYVDNPVGAAVGGVGLTQTSADDADTIAFNGVNQARSASVSIVQASGSGTAKRPGPAMHITAYEANPGNVDNNPVNEARTLVNNPTLAAANQGTAAPEVDIVGIKIHDATGAVIEYRTVNQAAGANNIGTLHGADSAVGIQFVLDNAGGTGTGDDIYSAVVSNLVAGYTVEFITATDHDLALVQNVSGSYDIGGFNVANQANIAAQDFHFSAQINDYDNDAYGGSAVTFANWTVHVNDITFT